MDVLGRRVGSVVGKHPPGGVPSVNEQGVGVPIAGGGDGFVSKRAHLRLPGSRIGPRLLGLFFLWGVS